MTLRPPTTQATLYTQRNALISAFVRLSTIKELYSP